MKQKPFKSFNHFKNFYLTLSASLPRFMRPMNAQNTASKTWATAFRMPDYLLEPKFLKIFDKHHSDFATLQEVHDQAKLNREKASLSLLGKPKCKLLSDPKYFGLVKLASKITMQQLGLYGQKFDICKVTDSADSLPTNTSSGHPDYIQRKGENLSYIKSQALKTLNSMDSSWLFYICTMAWRTQVRHSGLKYRIIWVTPHISQVFEMCFFKPIQDHFEKFKTTPYCFANVFVDLVPRIKQLRTKTSIFVIDFTAFDQSVPIELLALFFANFKQLFNIRSKHWDLQFNNIVKYNCSCNVFNVLNGIPTVFTKSGSISSGSVLTNFIGSWINLFLINLYIMDTGNDPSNQALNVMGDDCSFGFDFQFDVLHYQKWLLSNFGMLIEPDKCQELRPDFQSVEFLGAEINEQARIIDFDLVQRQLCVSERFIPEHTMSESVRLISKTASICFKFTEGWKYFDWIISKLLPDLDIDSMPEYYYELTYSAAGPYDYMVKRKISEFKYDGWKRQ